MVRPNETLPSLLADLLDQAGRTRAIVESHDLDEVGKPGDRWDGADPATLERVLFHLLQEYARHLGQLDVVVEVATGRSGELFSTERTPARAVRLRKKIWVRLVWRDWLTCGVAGLSTDRGKVEALRSKLKRLTERGWLAEDAGLFALPARDGDGAGAGMRPKTG